MVESKLFSTEESSFVDSLPPLVQVQAGEPLDLLHLQAVPVVEPSAPCHVYDPQQQQQQQQHQQGPSIVEPIPTIVTDETCPVNEPSFNNNNMEMEPQDPQEQLKVGAAVASGVLG